MKKPITITLIVAGIVLATQTGCATYAALTMPGPASDEAVEVGMHRAEVEGLLGVGSSSQYESGGTTTILYEYSDGPPQVSKLRSLVYVGGDVFTLFLTEIIFWPIELYAKKRIQRVATAEYDGEGRLVEWTIKRVSGETLDHKVASGPPDVASEPPDLASEPLDEGREPPDEGSAIDHEVSSGPPDEGSAIESE